MNILNVERDLEESLANLATGCDICLWATGFSSKLRKMRRRLSCCSLRPQR